MLFFYPPSLVHFSFFPSIITWVQLLPNLCFPFFIVLINTWLRSFKIHFMFKIFKKFFFHLFSSGPRVWFHSAPLPFPSPPCLSPPLLSLLFHLLEPWSNFICFNKPYEVVGLIICLFIQFSIHLPIHSWRSHLSICNFYKIFWFLNI